MDMELEATKRLALGRILRMASRPAQPGDVEEYNRCRAIIMTDAPDWAYARPVWMENMLAKGAQGD